MNQFGVNIKNLCSSNDNLFIFHGDKEIELEISHWSTPI